MAIPLRHELKFFISNTQYHALARTLAGVLKPDPNGDDRNEYHIRSLYFDTLNDDAMYEKINGEAERDKYRIRIYNLSDRVIKLECKSKFGSLISKRSLTIPRDLADQLIAGDTHNLAGTPSALLSDMFREMTLRQLRPRVLVDYTREAYLHDAEEVRITFDKGLHTGLYSTDLFNPYTPTVPAFDQGEIILEVKYNHMMPPHIRDILSFACPGALRSAISKYTICRRFEGFE